MGDLRSWSPELNGVVSEKKLSSSSSSSSSSPPLFLSNYADIGVDCWRRAEDATRGIIDQVQPTVVSEHRRKAVIDYVQRLIRNCVGCEVFPFGSVPLKTYLPDGDIDLTAFGGINVEEALANNVFAVLDSEDKNGAAEFVVKDVKLIHAEVKLVKCLIQNIVVDISFNQLGGLCTLCFLEQVDHLVGKDHLFKRSIILIKAWCYYESRILGAYHGLISTYALETLVLYIFHFFHSTLNGPLEVLFRFLDYFSKFDWENFCISLNGPVRISLLPEIFAEIPENSVDDLLLSNDFLANCVEMFSVPAKGCEPNMRAFPLKHLNIFDPLKENNNLGRSVNKGNFSRIRSALAFGASKLRSFLSQSEENIEDEVRMFFWNTLDRHGSRQRPDVQNCDPSSRWSGLGSPVLFSDVELQEDLTSNETEFAYSGVTMGEHRQGHGCDTDIKTTEDENSFGTAIKNEILGTSVPVASSTIFSEVNGFTNGTVISHDRLSPDAIELAISRLEDPVFSESALQSFPSSVEATSLPFGTGIHAPHLIFSGFSKGDEELKTGISDKKHSDRSTEKLELTGYMMKPSEDVSFIANGKQNGNHLVSHQDVHAPAGSKSNSSHVSTTSSDEILEALNSLSDLNGDYDSHLSSLHYGRWCYDYARTAPAPSMCPSLLSHSRSASQKRWNATQHTLQVEGNDFTHMNSNGILSRPAFYPIGPHILPGGTPFGLEEVQKPRGTGTYFPNVNHYREKTSSSMARNQVPVRSPRKNARVSAPPEINLPEKNHNDLSQSQNHVGLKNGCSDHTSGSPGRKLHHQSKGLIHRDESIVYSGSSGCQQENSRRPNFVSLLSRNLSGSLPLLEVQNSKLVLNVDQDRIAVKSYELKDDGDFPPLSI